MFVALFFDFKSLSEEFQRGLVAHLLYKSEGVAPDENFIYSLDIEVEINHIFIIILA